jgi:diacylglycerol kinase family enzyme
METRADMLSPDAGADAPATAILVNRQSGTVRSMGEDAARALLSGAFGGKAELFLVSGSDVAQTVRELLSSGRFAQIVVGGGDGTVASVGSMLAGSGIAMGILPMGTMNLMANALGMSTDLGQALAQLETASARSVDAARAGERLFLHHISFGIQPRIVRIRERLGYSTRLTKMLSGMRALLSVLLRPKSHRLALEIDGRPRLIKAPALIVSNNIYEDSAWLKQAVLDEGLLGIYALLPMSRLALLRLTLDLLRGRWRDNLNVAEEHGRAVTIHISRRRFGRLRRRIWASIDGELALLDLPLRIESQPGALRMLVPAPPATEPAGGT